MCLPWADTQVRPYDRRIRWADAMGGRGGRTRRAGAWADAVGGRGGRTRWADTVGGHGGRTRRSAPTV
ncbi:MAG: hypothetical protein M5U11_04115 [Anaerolineales bacterium]|nr:hypothetical protein [Anaerolineales bacterium]